MSTFVIPGHVRAFIGVPPSHPFPIQNLPYGVFSTTGGEPRCGVAIGDFVMDLAACAERGLFALVDLDTERIFGADSLNPFMAEGRKAWTAVRRRLFELLDAASSPFPLDEDLRKALFHPRDAVRMHMPATIGDYTDFYSSREHATNVGTMFRGPDNALMPNWLHLPVAYHGRASSIVVSGTPVRRPKGQLKPSDGAPTFGPTRLLDFELEMGYFVGPGTPLGTSIGVEEAGDHIFGFVLVNDWSARDIQKWEYVPLGPFLGKNFATSISPWIVPTDALEPFRVAGPAQDPEPLEYLQSGGDWALNVDLEVAIQPAGRPAAVTVSRSNARYLYWNVCQQLAHHTSGGCNTRAGDLMASGTISGPDPGSYGSLLELTWRGERPLDLGEGSQYRFIRDGDTVILRGAATGEGFRIGFGDVAGTVLPAHE